MARHVWNIDGQVRRRAYHSENTNLFHWEVCGPCSFVFHSMLSLVYVSSSNASLCVSSLFKVMLALWSGILLRWRCWHHMKWFFQQHWYHQKAKSYKEISSCIMIFSISFSRDTHTHTHTHTHTQLWPIISCYYKFSFSVYFCTWLASMTFTVWQPWITNLWVMWTDG